MFPVFLLFNLTSRYNVPFWIPIVLTASFSLFIAASLPEFYTLLVVKNFAGPLAWLVLTLSYQLVIGLLIGLLFGWVFRVSSVTAGIMETSMGLGLSTHGDGPLEKWYPLLLITVFVSSGGFHSLIVVLTDSFLFWPIGSTPDLSPEPVFEILVFILNASVVIALPVVITVLLLRSAGQPDQ